MAHILVIDDEESIRFSFQRFLTAKKHSVVTVDGYRMALSRMNQEYFDLILADINLQDGCGIDILQEVALRKIKTRVIIMTAYPAIETIAASFDMHASDYLIKPLRQEELLSIVDKAMR